jgi:uncharacterized repeat protein (TIGR02059 family)
MVAQALRFRLYGWLAPQVSANQATVNGTSLVIPLTQGVPAAGAVTANQFTVTVNGVARGVSTATVAGQNCTLVLASAVTNGQTVKVSYAGGGAVPLKNAAGDLTPPFAISVTNNTP